VWLDNADPTELDSPATPLASAGAALGGSAGFLAATARVVDPERFAVRFCAVAVVATNTRARQAAAPAARNDDEFMQCKRATSVP
jgi:hypothetical protein